MQFPVQSMFVTFVAWTDDNVANCYRPKDQQYVRSDDNSLAYITRTPTNMTRNSALVI